MYVFFRLKLSSTKNSIQAIMQAEQDQTWAQSRMQLQVEEIPRPVPLVSMNPLCPTTWAFPNPTEGPYKNMHGSKNGPDNHPAVYNSDIKILSID